MSEHPGGQALPGQTGKGREVVPEAVALPCPQFPILVLALDLWKGCSYSPLGKDPCQLQTPAPVPGG